MERYIGMDVHAASCTLAVISEKGRKLKDFPVETNGQAEDRPRAGFAAAKECSCKSRVDEKATGRSRDCRRRCGVGLETTRRAIGCGHG